MPITDLWPFKTGQTVVFIGKRGVGKSSTLNHLFGFTQSTDPATEATVARMLSGLRLMRPSSWRFHSSDGFRQGRRSASGSLTCPASRPVASRTRGYRHWLSRADTVAWITQANVRAYKQDQIFFRDYSKYVRSGTRLVLALSKADTQVDDLSAADLNSDVLIRKAADATAEIIPYSWAKPDDVTVVPYSIAQEWNLERLRAAALDRQLVETS
jgi:predicted GTPase